MAYISLISELLNWTIPTHHLLQHHQSSQSPNAKTEIRGLDIGTGASAIYPLLGTSCFPNWRFVGTDVDGESLEYAREHVLGHPGNDGKLEKRINLVYVKEQDPFLPPDGEYAFTMCNPPFYTSFDEMQASALAKRLPPNAVSVPFFSPLPNVSPFTHAYD